VLVVVAPTAVVVRVELVLGEQGVLLEVDELHVLLVVGELFESQVKLEVAKGGARHG